MHPLASPLSRGAPAALPEHWPLRAHSHTARVAPYRWHLVRKGRGRDALLLHGAGASSHSWHRLIEPLSKRYRITAPDLPGHHLTRSYTRARLSLPQMRDDLHHLLGRLGVSPRLMIGHSAGAALALSLAARLPAPPDFIVLINGAVENFRGPAAIVMPLMARLLALNPLAGPFLSHEAQRPDAVRKMLRVTGSHLDEEGMSYYEHLVADPRHIDGTVGMMASWSLNSIEPLLPKLSCPVLLLHADGDGAVSVNVAKRAAAVLPNATLKVLPGCGHLVHEERPELVLDAIEAFIAAQDVDVRA